MSGPPIDPARKILPHRKITGISATLLPFNDSGMIDWLGFHAHCLRTAEAGLIPAVNMDTGFGNLLDPGQRRAVLDATRSALGRRPFVAGVFVGDSPGAGFTRDGYLRSMQEVLDRGATPVIFQSFGLTGLPDPELIAAYDEIGNYCENFIAFELGEMFAPFGKIYSLGVYRDLLGIRKCIGAKHSSLQRRLEWERLALRDQVRPDFRVYTGNDLAIDMVMYGSDYLLGLSTFAPDYFALRDKYWELGDARFHELNDVLQYLGFLAFRSPVPAYKHSAAMFLKLRGWIGCDITHPLSPTRPASDREILHEIFRQLEALNTK
ncbi:MAG TPA: dihydrodipicolinate synthase family protein [Gemmata sp.]|nr:dihydrodipicolinate synthase family protein [Gemmata sp.]